MALDLYMRWNKTTPALEYEVNGTECYGSWVWVVYLFVTYANSIVLYAVHPYMARVLNSDKIPIMPASVSVCKYLRLKASTDTAVIITWCEEFESSKIKIIC